jgi:hypothetical protein
MRLRQWRMLCTATALGLFAALLGARTSAEELKNANAVAASEARLKRDVTFLASDQCEGRGPTTKGLVLAGDYIAKEFNKAGLVPGGKDGSYFQPFAIAGAKLEAPAQLTLKSPAGVSIALREGTEFNALGISGSGKASAGVVFAGYGISAQLKMKVVVGVLQVPFIGQVVQEKAERLDYDDYANLDAAGKLVVVLRDAPRAANHYLVPPQWKQRNGALSLKIQNAEKHNAAAIVIVNDHGMVGDGDDLMDFNFHAMVGSSAKIPAFTIHRAQLQLMLGSVGENLERVEQDIDRELKPHSVALTGWTADVEARVARSNDLLPLRNIIGYLEGKGPLGNEMIVVGAHYDHVGYGGFGSMAGVRKPTIHHGADDNASGSTSVMELARRFAAMPNREGRKIVFMTFSGEELGLLGSRYFCEHPLIELKDVAAMINLDMVGRVSQDEQTKKGRLFFEGYGSAKMLESIVDRLNVKYDFKLGKNPIPIPYSDHYSFYAKKVPVCFFWNNTHPDYHRPSDTSDKINVPDMRRVVDMTEELITYLATTTERPEFQQVKTPSNSSRTNIPRMGFAPAYGEDSGEGVLVDAVNEGQPADKAGIKKGDRIIEIAGKPVKNLEAYMSVMGAQKRGETIEITVMREKKKITLKVKPE